jgi:hypothetical protein
VGVVSTKEVLESEKGSEHVEVKSY